jgi:hypothetical protein
MMMEDKEEPAAADDDDDSDDDEWLVFKMWLRFGDICCSLHDWG